MRLAWLQKHPSPTAKDGAFHWHADDDRDDRELRARFVERMRGIEPPAVLWSIDPSRVAWAMLWAASSPLDHRRYTGMTLAIAASLGDIALPPPGPHGVSIEPVAKRTADVQTIRAIAAALLDGVSITVAAIDPAMVERIERELPRVVQRRERACVARIGTAPASATSDASSLLARACIGDASAIQAWSLVRDLADATNRMPGEILGAPKLDDLVSRVHAWGRGRLDVTVETLADATAARAIAHALGGRSASRAIDEVRWHALLPASRRTALLDAIATRAPTLAKEIDHA